MRSTTTQYFNEVSTLGLPTKAEATARFREYAVLRRELAIETDPGRRSALDRRRATLKGRIAEGYLRFVIKSARDRTRDRDTLLSDLIGAGNEGLLVAIDKFDLAFGTQFLTYAAYWIEVKMDDVLHGLDQVHVPTHTRKQRSQRGDPPAVTMTPLDDLQVAAQNDVYREALPHGRAAVGYLHAAGLTRRERLVLNLALGLRGTPLNDERLSLVLLGVDGSVMTPTEVRIVREGALERVRAWVQAQGESVRLELGG